MLKINDKGAEVITAKAMLHTVMGIDAEMSDVFTQAMQQLVRKFQKENGLSADGIIGEKTFTVLARQFSDITFLQKPLSQVPEKTTNSYTLERVICDIYTDFQKQNSYSGCLMRNDAAAALENVKKELNSYGCILATSGGLRDLYEKVSVGRSATSLHYTGIAFDLYLGAGMINTTIDPYVVQRVVKDNRTSYIVWARCSSQKATSHIPHAFVPENIVTYASRIKAVKCEDDHFVNLTEIFNKYGFSNIKAHTSFEKGGSMTGSEWWHFQFDKQLVKGVSTFGDELHKIYTQKQLQNTPPYQFKDKVWGVDWN